MIISARCASSCTTHNRQKDLIKTLTACKGYNSRCIAHARPQSVACVAQVLKELPQADKSHDDKLSKRDLELDEMGYFIILLDRENNAIVVDHYKNTINDQGLACDETTGEVISCAGSVRKPSKSFSGKTAKQLSVEILEENSGLCSRLEHANYLGRELQKAEFALINSLEYIQD